MIAYAEGASKKITNKKNNKLIIEEYKGKERNPSKNGIENGEDSVWAYNLDDDSIN